jgi:hypothetical protein
MSSARRCLRMAEQLKRSRPNSLGFTLPPCRLAAARQDLAHPTRFERVTLPSKGRGWGARAYPKLLGIAGCSGENQPDLGTAVWDAGMVVDRRPDRLSSTK